MTPNDTPWDTRYEWRAIALLTLASGLLGLDRFIVNPLFPAMMRDLSLDYQDLGNMGAVLAVTWGLCALLMGRVSDRVGRRRVIIPSIVVFSVLVGATGLVGGLASLLVVRAIMGVAEGACVPAANVAAIEASKPSRKGFNFGIFANGLPLIGLGLGPILAIQLLFLLPSWRWVFAVVAIPGLVTAYLLHRVLRDTRAGATEGWLFALLLSYAMFAFSAFVILIGPMATESVDVSLASTAVGIISGVGEIVGGGAAPALAGYIAKHFGIEKVFYTALVALILALLLITALHETRTRGLPGAMGARRRLATGG